VIKENSLTRSSSFTCGHFTTKTNVFLVSVSDALSLLVTIFTTWICTQWWLEVGTH